MTIISITLTELLSGDIRTRLAGLLAAGATVTIACHDVVRLPVSMLAISLDLAATTSGFLRLEGLSSHALKALQVIDPARRLAVDDVGRVTQLGERPYQVSLSADGSLRVALGKGIGQHPHLTEPASYDWIRGLDASAVVIDLVHIEHLNSLLVAWLLQLNQGAGPGRCRLVQVGRQATAQLSQLRLDHLLNVR